MQQALCPPTTPHLLRTAGVDDCSHRHIPHLVRQRLCDQRRIQLRHMQVTLHGLWTLQRRCSKGRNQLSGSRIVCQQILKEVGWLCQSPLHQRRVEASQVRRQPSDGKAVGDRILGHPLVSESFIACTAHTQVRYVLRPAPITVTCARHLACLHPSKAEHEQLDLTALYPARVSLLSFQTTALHIPCEHFLRLRVRCHVVLLTQLLRIFTEDCMLRVRVAFCKARTQILHIFVLIGVEHVAPPAPPFHQIRIRGFIL